MYASRMDSVAAQTRATPGQRWSAPLASARRAAPYALLGLAVLAPFALSAGDDVVGDMVLAAAYVVMALGLNIVVGFAGLLDLGYVAFYAIGAYTAAHLASGFWDNAGAGGEGVAILVGGPAAELPGIHMSFLLVLVVAAVATTLAGVVIAM